MAKVRTTISAKSATVVRRVVEFMKDEANTDTVAALVKEFGINVPDFQRSLLQMHGRTAGAIVDDKLTDEAATRRLISKFVGVADGAVKIDDLAASLGL